MGYFWGTAPCPALPAGRISSTDSVHAASDTAHQPGSYRDHRHGSSSGILLKHVLLWWKLQGCWHRVVKSDNLNVKHSKHCQWAFVTNNSVANYGWTCACWWNSRFCVHCKQTSAEFQRTLARAGHTQRKAHTVSALCWVRGSLPWEDRGQMATHHH